MSSESSTLSLSSTSSSLDNIDLDKFVKVTNFECIHNGFKFKGGLNTDTIPFKTEWDCCAGGIYFCKLRDMARWLDYTNACWIWDVKIPEIDEKGNNVEVKHYENKSKASSIFLSNKRLIKDLDLWNNKEFQIEAVKQNGLAIRFIKDPNEELKLLSVKENGSAIRHIKDPSEEMKLEAIKQSGYAIQYIKDPSEELKLQAVKRDGYAIQYILNPSEELQLEAVSQNPLSIDFISNPSEEVLLKSYPCISTY